MACLSPFIHSHPIEDGIDKLSVTEVTMAMAVCVILDISIHACRVIDRFKKYKQAGSHSNSFRLTNGRSDDTGKITVVV